MVWRSVPIVARRRHQRPVQSGDAPTFVVNEDLGVRCRGRVSRRVTTDELHIMDSHAIVPISPVAVILDPHSDRLPRIFSHARQEVVLGCFACRSHCSAASCRRHNAGENAGLHRLVEAGAHTVLDLRFLRATQAQHQRVPETAAVGIDARAFEGAERRIAVAGLGFRFGLPTVVVAAEIRLQQQTGRRLGSGAR